MLEQKLPVPNLCILARKTQRTRSETWMQVTQSQHSSKLAQPSDRRLPTLYVLRTPRVSVSRDATAA